MKSLSCAEARATLLEIKSLRDEFGRALEDALRTQDRKQAHTLRRNLESRMQELRDSIILPIERKLDVKRQYEAQASILESAGILERLSSGEFGIHGIDGKAYPMPSYREIAKRIREKKEILMRKKEQGFVKLLIVPFGMKLDDLIEKYRALLLKHEAEGRLFAAKEKDIDPDEPLDLDVSEPVWAWSEYTGADVNGKLVYDPKEFSQNHGGKTKAEIIASASPTQPSRGYGGQAWRILMLEANPNIPRQNNGLEIGTRKQLEANKTPREYLQDIGKGAYEHESGMTPEDWLTYAMTMLEEKNQVIDDYQGKGSVNYNTGAYFPVSGRVPVAFWSRGDRRASVSRDVPSNRIPICGARSAVRV